MKIKPLSDRVLVRPNAAEEVTVSGIIIPDTAKEKPLKGTILVAIAGSKNSALKGFFFSNGNKDEEMVVKEGDVVLYGKYAGTEIEVDGEKLLIMRQGDILAICE